MEDMTVVRGRSISDASSSQTPIRHATHLTEKVEPRQRLSEAVPLPSPAFKRIWDKL